MPIIIDNKEITEIWLPDDNGNSREIIKVMYTLDEKTDKVVFEKKSDEPVEIEPEFYIGLNIKYFEGKINICINNNINTSKISCSYQDLMDNNTYKYVKIPNDFFDKTLHIFFEKDENDSSKLDIKDLIMGIYFKSNVNYTKDIDVTIQILSFHNLKYVSFNENVKKINTHAAGQWFDSCDYYMFDNNHNYGINEGNNNVFVGGIIDIFNSELLETLYNDANSKFAHELWQNAPGENDDEKFNVWRNNAFSRKP